jgi:hypothetical protein
MSWPQRSRFAVTMRAETGRLIGDFHRRNARGGNYPTASGKRDTPVGGPEARGVQANAKATGFELRAVVSSGPPTPKLRRPPGVIGAFGAGFHASKAGLFASRRGGYV